MAKHEIDSQLLDEALERLSAFVIQLAGELREGAPFEHEHPITAFSKEGYGWIELTGETTRQYLRCLNAILEVVNEDNISRKAVDRLLKDLILETVDIKKQHAAERFEDRLRRLLDRLRTQLTAPPVLHHVCIRITGIDVGDKPITFGKVTFDVFPTERFRAFKQDYEAHLRGQRHQDVYLSMLEDYTESELTHQTVAEVEVMTIDDHAARSNALRELRFTLDILNFFGALIQGRGVVRARVFGDSDVPGQSIPVFRQDPEPHVGHSLQRLPPLGRLRLSEVLESAEFDLNRLSDILKAEDRNGYEDRLLTAIQWAGRAAAAERREESHLFYAIALECLLMERERQRFVTAKLRQRLSTLLSSRFESKTISELTENIYDMRSAIVHHGRYEISEADQNLIRFLAEQAIIEVLRNPLFNSDEEFLRWLANDTKEQ